jgi:hypothetical protein
MNQGSSQGEINWRKVYTTRIATCCTRAAQDFNLTVESPFTVQDANGTESHFIALFPSLGGGKGMLVCLSSEWSVLEPVAANQGYCCAGLDPKHHSSYDRDQWQGIVSAWAPEGSSP